MSHPIVEHATLPEIRLIGSPDWKDYELLDSGDGAKLERYGPYVFVRPEPEAVWRPARPQKEWDAAQAVFQPSPEENGGHWLWKDGRRGPDERWKMQYKELKFWAQVSNSSRNAACSGQRLA